ncbi:hypothetical protein KO528_00710 [Saccharophagus degradans]|uniref:hypothetical protein n=1 Tax=Saccharophagus degradans TaxID=86304 RepID=UPI001C083A4F|nr:hypothetical protein [Saccharophagus degradans]MBU2983857.1 hypothetical protein [Saccharophagus degradans]
MSELTLATANLSQSCVEELSKYFDTSTLPTTTSSPQSLTILGVKCDLVFTSANNDASQIIIAASPQSNSNWNLGDCLPKLPGAEEEGSADHLFRIRHLSFEKSLWLLVWGENIDPQMVRNQLIDSDSFKNWANLHVTKTPTTNTNSNTADYAAFFDSLGFNVNSIALTAEDSDTNSSTTGCGLFIWGDIQQTSANRTLELLPWLNDIQTFLGTSNLRFACAKIQNKSSYPQVSVQLPPSGTSFGNNQLQFTNAAVTLLSIPYFTPSDTSISVSGDFVFGQNIIIHTDLVYPIHSDLIWAKGTYKGSVESLLGGEATLGLPSDGPALANEDTIELELEFSKSRRTLTKISFAAQLNEKQWTAIPAPIDLTLEGLAFYITIVEPFSASRNVSAQLLCDATFASESNTPYSLTCGGTYPEGQLFLRAKQPLPIGSLISNLIGSSNGLDAFTFDDLRIDYNYRSNIFGLNIDVKGPWQIADGFTARDIALRIDRNNGFSGDINATLTLAGSEAILEAQKASSESDWVFSANIAELHLSKLISQLFTELALPITLPDIILANTQLALEPAKGNYSFQSQTGSNSQWELDLDVTKLTISALALSAEKKEGNFSGKLLGSASLFGTDVTVSIELTNALTLTVSATNVNLSRIIDELLPEIDFPAEIPNVVFDTVSMTVTPATKEFSLSASTTEDWEIPLGATGFLVEDIQFTAQRKQAANNTYKTSGTVVGNASLGPVSFDLNYSYPGELLFGTEIPKLNLSPVIQDMCGPDSLMGINLPPSVSNLALENIKLTVSPNKKFMSLSSQSPLGDTELLITQTRQKKWAFMVAFAPPPQWKFSSIDNALAVMDDLTFRDTGLIISSAQDDLPPITIVTVPQSLKLVKGLNFFATLDMTGLGVDDLMSVKSLTVSTTIGTSIDTVRLAAAMEGSFKIDDNVALGDMEFFLRPAPSNFQLGISGSVLAKIDQSDLRFIGTMSIRPTERSAAFAATMLGNWDQPFGIKGLGLQNVAIEVGVGIVPPPAVAAPIVGLAGSISIGSFTGSAAVKFDTATPTKSMIAASFNQIFLKDVVQTFCEDKVYNAIPAAIRNSVLSAGMEDVAVYAVPQLTTIGELVYEAGFKFEGKISVANFDAQCMFLLDYKQGFAIKGTCDPIVIEDIFKITGVESSPGPLLDIDLRVGGNPHIQIEGLIDLLGINALALVSVSDSGFRFEVEGQIFDLFSAKIAASGGNLKEGGDFYLMVEMHNELITYLREQALKGIQNAANDATESLSSAQSQVDKAQREVNKLNQEIDEQRANIKKERARDARNVKNAEDAVNSAQKEVNRLQGLINTTRKTIEQERARDTKRIKDAENAVASAQSKVNALQTDINNMRKTIKAERAKTTRNLNSAKKTLTNAQNEVNSLQSKINTNKKKISSLKKNISDKKRWYNKSKWYQKSYRWAEFSAYSAAKGAEITALYTAIGSLETAKATANAALEIAKQSVRGIQAAADTFPVDADPRIAGLFTAKETANIALEAAKQTLKGLQATIKLVPVDSDPRILGLFTAKETANAALEVAKQSLIGLQAAIKDFPIDADPRIAALFSALGIATGGLQSAKLILEGIKQSVGGLAEASSFIVEYGLGGVLDIKRIYFEGSLNVVKGGNVSMALQLVLMKNNLNVDLAFSFHDPLKSADALVKKLLKEIG